MAFLFSAEADDEYRGTEDIWERVQWQLRDMLVQEDDPLLREALYRHGEHCIRCSGADGERFRERRLKQLQVTYLMAAERHDGLLC